MRRGHGRASGQRADPPGDRTGHRGAAQPRASRRLGRGSRAPATAPASSCRCPTSCCAPSPACGCRRSAATGCRCASCRPTSARARLEGLLERIVRAEGQLVLGWRDVPVRPSTPATSRVSRRPTIRQLFVGAGPEHAGDQDAFERKLYVIRRVCEISRDDGGLYVASSSSRTLNLQGHADQLAARGLLPRPARRALRARSRSCTRASRPTRSRAGSSRTPTALIGHNGEINTLQGNVNWMRARESELRSELFGDDLPKILPVVDAGGSDSATFDNVLELLMLAGRSPAHAVMMMIPEAYSEPRRELPPELGGFYAFHCMPDGAVGRPRRDGVHRRTRRSVRRSTATACVPAAGSRPPTAT